MSFVYIDSHYALINNSEDGDGGKDEDGDEKDGGVDGLCEHVVNRPYRPDKYEDLINKFNNYGIDYVEGNICVDIRRTTEGIIEEAVAEIDGFHCSDGTILRYGRVSIIFNVICVRSAVVRNKVTGTNFCEECFTKTHAPQSFDYIKKVLTDKNTLHGLTTCQKIIRVLQINKKTNGRPMSSRHIFEAGEPWELTTMTPYNSVCSRISDMAKKGEVKKNGSLYYL